VEPPEPPFQPYPPANGGDADPSPAAWALPDSGAGGGAVDPPGPGAPAGPPGAGAPAPDGRAGFDPETPRAKAPIRLPVALRPMTMSDLLDGAFAIIKSRPAAVFGVSAAIVIPFQILQAWLSRGLVSSNSLTTIFNQPTSSNGVRQQNVDALNAYIGLTLGTLAVFLVGCALAKLVSTWYAGGDATAGDALRATVRILPAALAAWALLLIPLAMSLAAVCVGWFFVDPFVIAVAPILMIEKVGPIKAISRSFSLVTRRYLMVTGANALATVMALIADRVLTLLPDLLAGLVGAPWNWIITAVGNSIVSLLLIPAVAGVAILLYLDLRVRTEGLDIELQATDTFASAA
jgi:flagellar biosynthesis protein FlhB